MKLAFRTLLVAIAAFVITSTAFAQEDVAGSRDYPGISRMPGYYIYEYTELPFDTFTFTVKEAGKTKEQPVEGHQRESPCPLRLSTRARWEREISAGEVKKNWSSGPPAE